MEIVLLVARLLLAAIFIVAGVAKAADPSGSRRAIEGFGVSKGLAPILGRLLPVAEIGIAIALLPIQTAWIGSIAALALLTIFASAIGINLARGRANDCHCFGQLHSAPVGWSTLTRNLVLMAMALLVVAQGNRNPGASAVDWLQALRPGEIASLTLSAFTIVLVVSGVAYMRRLLDQQSTLVARIEAMKKVIDEDYAEPQPVERADAAAPSEGLPVGAPAPAFSLATINGEQVTLNDLLSFNKPLLLLFVSPGCSPCKTVFQMVSTWQRDYSASLTIALLSKGTLKENEDELTKFGAKNLLLIGESNVGEQYDAKWTPAAVLIRPDGKIASLLSYGDDAIREMVTRGAGMTADGPRKRELEVMGNGHKPEITIGTAHAYDDVGKPAPSFSLPNADGDLVHSDQLLGRDTLLLFWDPKCPFCRSISDALKGWEVNPPANAPRLVIVSSAEGEDASAESKEFKSLYLCDPSLEVGVMFGTNLTPSAVLIDRDGKIASAPTPGPENIMALVGVSKTSMRWIPNP